jgi:hypothetical protein
VSRSVHVAAWIKCKTIRWSERVVTNEATRMCPNTMPTAFARPFHGAFQNPLHMIAIHTGTVQIVSCSQGLTLPSYTPDNIRMSWKRPPVGDRR